MYTLVQKKVMKQNILHSLLYSQLSPSFEVVLHIVLHRERLEHCSPICIF